MRKRLAVFLTLLMCLTLAACGTSSGSEEKETASQKATITSEYQAINAVKNEQFLTGKLAEQRIAGELGFNQFYSPNYGVCDATQDDTDGSWIVTLRGSMSGYTDDYQSDFATFKFELEAKVSADGTVFIRNTKKVN